MVAFFFLYFFSPFLIIIFFRLIKGEEPIAPAANLTPSLLDLDIPLSCELVKPTPLEHADSNSNTPASDETPNSDRFLSCTADQLSTSDVAELLASYRAVVEENRLLKATVSSTNNTNIPQSNGLSRRESTRDFPFDNQPMLVPTPRIIDQ